MRPSFCIKELNYCSDYIRISNQMVQYKIKYEQDSLAVRNHSLTGLNVKFLRLGLSLQAQDMFVHMIAKMKKQSQPTDIVVKYNIRIHNTRSGKSLKWDPLRRKPLKQLIDAHVVEKCEEEDYYIINPYYYNTFHTEAKAISNSLPMKAYFFGIKKQLMGKNVPKGTTFDDIDDKQLLIIK